jgi:hypothetical protein
MPQQLWPFLMAANKTLDYRAVVCPDTVMRSKRPDLLRTIVGEQDESPPGTVYKNSIADDRLGTLDVYYRVEPLMRSDTRARDRKGRPLLRIAGFIIRGSDDAFSDDTALEWLEKLRPEFDKALDEFWPMREWRPIHSRARTIATPALARLPVRQQTTLRTGEKIGLLMFLSPFAAAFLVSVALNLILALISWQQYHRLNELRAESDRRVARIHAELDESDRRVAKIQAELDDVRRRSNNFGSNDPAEQH